jgi:hypothetical protein
MKAIHFFTPTKVTLIETDTNLLAVGIIHLECGRLGTRHIESRSGKRAAAATVAAGPQPLPPP